MAKIIRILGIIMLISSLVGIVITNITRPHLLIQIGIRALDGLKTTLIITSLIGAGISTLSFVPQIKNLIDSGKHKRLLKESNEKKQNTFEEYSKDSLNPNKTRDRLATLKQNNADLTEIVEKCLNQMDRMDSIQDRYTTLIQANDAIYLNDTISAINDTETRLCHNIRSIINCCILVEDGSSTFSEFDMKIIDKALNQNETELQNANKLTHYAVNYINNYQQNGITDMNELNAWIKVMEQSNTSDDTEETQ